MNGHLCEIASPLRWQACKSVRHDGEEHAAFQTGSPLRVLDKDEG